MRRDLPWRRTTDPYAILVSEVMLQQTQVARVVPRYEAWLERWPTAGALASAPVADVLPAGSASATTAARCGCARRARRVAQHGWPQDLTELPGRRRLHRGGARARSRSAATAAALDTNVRRVFARHAARARARRRAPAGGPVGAVQPGDDRARRPGLPRARAALRRVPAEPAARGTATSRRARAGRALRGHRPLGARPRRRGAGRGGGASAIDPGGSSVRCGARARRARCSATVSGYVPAKRLHSSNVALRVRVRAGAGDSPGRGGQRGAITREAEAEAERIRSAARETKQADTAGLMAIVARLRSGSRGARGADQGVAGDDAPQPATAKTTRAPKKAVAHAPAAERASRRRGRRA